MKTSAKKEMPDKDSRLSPIEREEAVSGSGFTYNEKEESTDKSIPINKVDGKQIVQLPDLGQQNRP